MKTTLSIPQQVEVERHIRAVELFVSDTQPDFLTRCIIEKNEIKYRPSTETENLLKYVPFHSLSLTVDIVEGTLTYKRK